jgi:hypothetical protein
MINFKENKKELVLPFPMVILLTGMVAITWFVVGSITDTLSDASLVTYTRPLTGLTATPSGASPTGISLTYQYR